MTPSRASDLVNITVQTKKQYRVPIQQIRQVTRQTLKATKRWPCEVSICLVSNHTMRRLNKKYKGRDATTDVLAFPLQQKRSSTSSAGVRLLGEIVISLDQTKKNALYFGTTFRTELLLYIIHGILHLVGYDDMTPTRRKVMERTQQALLMKTVVRKMKKK